MPYSSVSDRTSGVTFTCDFEADENECVFQNAMGDIFNWTVYTVSNVILLFIDAFLFLTQNFKAIRFEKIDLPTSF